MSDGNKPRLVYSTDPSAADPPRPHEQEAIPARIVVTVRIERAGRGGKTVTIIEGLPRNTRFVADLARDLKRACGAGGTLADGAIELQGELRARVKEILSKRGFVVRG